MKKTVITSPTFTPASQTVNTGITDFDIRNLYAIINQTTGALIYATATPGKGFTNVSQSTVTLEYDTTSMSSTDKLQIIYDDPEDTQLAQALYEVVERLTFLTGVRGPAANLRVTVTDGSVAVSSGTVTTLSNQTSLGGYTANQIVPSTVNIGAIQSNINNIQVNIS